MAEIFEEVVTLAPGASATVPFYLTPGVAKTYSVRVDGLSGSFVARAPAPPGVADIVVTDLVITPPVVDIGDTVTISVRATNRGTVTGTKTITLTVS